MAPVVLDLNTWVQVQVDASSFTEVQVKYFSKSLLQEKLKVFACQKYSQSKT